jgi:hypothetical protein
MMIDKSISYLRHSGHNLKGVTPKTEEYSMLVLVEGLAV